MLTIGFLPNTLKDTNLDFTNMLIEFALKKKCIAVVPDDLHNTHVHAQRLPLQNIFKCADFLVILGGDGTILRFAEQASIYDKPLLGINLGTLGYLTDVEKSHSMEAINKVINNSYKIEKRMMLESIINNTECIALNDIYISKGVSAKMLKIKIYINDEYIDTYCADGIIFSTPTGSTAYNLSAGGPILKPDVDMIAITPICPHTLYARPFVISGEDVIRVVPCERHAGDIIISADGKEKDITRNGYEIFIKKSVKYTSIIKTNNLGFYDILRQKMLKAGG